MKIQTKPQLSNATATNFMPGRSLLLQRQCARSSSAGTSGEYAACANKRRLQAKLSIGASNDPMEREAEQVASQVLANPVHPTLGKAPHIQSYTGQATSFAAAPASVERVLVDAAGRWMRPCNRTWDNASAMIFPGCACTPERLPSSPRAT